jgi:hypothetical protein
MRNLAYHRAGYEFPIGWKEKPLKETADFWITLNGNFFDTRVLEWCKLFGEPGGEHYWERIVSDPTLFKEALLAQLGIADVGFEALRKKMRHYRDKFVAHLDSDSTAFLPMLDIAKTSVAFYHSQVVSEALGDELVGLTDTDLKLRLGHEQCEKDARSVYERAGFKK